MKHRIANELKYYIDVVPLLDRWDRVYPVTGSMISNVMTALGGLTLVSEQIEQPAWLGKQPDTTEYLSMHNGLLDVERAATDPKNALRPQSAEWFSPVYLPYDYDRNATCPLWLNFLNEVLEADADRIAMLQDWFGYLLTPDTAFHKFLILEGEGDNGKSVALEVLGAMLGPANVSSVPLECFGERFQLTPTLGKLANIAPEVDDVRLAEGRVKQFVSGEMMYFDRKGIDGTHRKPTARLVVATNKRPAIGDKSNGFWRRVLYLPFNFVVREKNLRLSQQLRDWELSGILNWALAGRKRLYENKQFTTSAVSELIVTEYRSQGSPEREFFSDFLMLEPAGFVAKDVIYLRYKDWASGHGHTLLGQVEFLRELKRAFPGITDARPTVAGIRVRGYNGLSFASAFDSIDIPAAA
jgi:putative DNA primase/helicase